MKVKTKVLTLVLCAVLLVVTTVFATIAFLTSTDSVNNTFTVGKVAITLDEEDVDGSKTDSTTEGRDKANVYHLIPGKHYTKDPIIHVGENSENCYIFVKVENGLADAEAAGDTTIAAQMKANGWALVDDKENVYILCDESGNKKSVAAKTDVAVFESFTIADDAIVAIFGTAAINVTAYSIQADGFETEAPEVIWANFNS